MNRQSSTGLTCETRRSHGGPVEVNACSRRSEIDVLSNKLVRSQVEREWEAWHNHAGSPGNVGALCESDRARVAAQALNRIRDSSSTPREIHYLSRSTDYTVNLPQSRLNIHNEIDRSTERKAVSTVIKITNIRPVDSNRIGPRHGSRKRSFSTGNWCS